MEASRIKNPDLAAQIDKCQLAWFRKDFYLGRPYSFKVDFAEHRIETALLDKI